MTWITYLVFACNGTNFVKCYCCCCCCWTLISSLVCFHPFPLIWGQFYPKNVFCVQQTKWCLTLPVVCVLKHDHYAIHLALAYCASDLTKNWELTWNTKWMANTGFELTTAWIYTRIRVNCYQPCLCAVLFMASSFALYTFVVGPCQSLSVRLTKSIMLILMVESHCF